LLASLLWVRVAPRSRLGLSPYEMLYGKLCLHSFHDFRVPDGAHVRELNTISYVRYVSLLLAGCCTLTLPESWRLDVTKDLEEKHLEGQFHPH